MPVRDGASWNRCICHIHGEYKNVSEAAKPLNPLSGLTIAQALHVEANCWRVY
jgi:hypothetical protein